MMIPEHKDFNTVTAEEWRASSDVERLFFMNKVSRFGLQGFVCLNCGFPSDRGRAFCESCRL